LIQESGQRPLLFRCWKIWKRFGSEHKFRRNSGKITDLGAERSFQEHQGTIITHTIDQSHFREAQEVPHNFNDLQSFQGFNPDMIVQQNMNFGTQFGEEAKMQEDLFDIRIQNLEPENFPKPRIQ
jgi:hypothetical protein